MSIKKTIYTGYCLWISCILLACDSTTTKYKRYYAQGKYVYDTHCANCHQKNGKGLSMLYPPLAQSDFIDSNFAPTLCLIKYGQQGEVIVNGNIYNEPMPGAGSLSTLEIAELATFIYNSWGRSRGIITVDTVNYILDQCNP